MSRSSMTVTHLRPWSSAFCEDAIGIDIARLDAEEVYLDVSAVCGSRFCVARNKGSVIGVDRNVISLGLRSNLLKDCV